MPKRLAVGQKTACNMYKGDDDLQPVADIMKCVVLTKEKLDKLDEDDDSDNDEEEGETSVTRKCWERHVNMAGKNEKINWMKKVRNAKSWMTKVRRKRRI